MVEQVGVRLINVGAFCQRACAMGGQYGAMGAEMVSPSNKEISASF
jgi:hypothetical protein